MTYLADLLAQNPFLCWPLDDLGTTTLRDATGNGHPASIAGTGFSQGNPPLVGVNGYNMGWTAPGNVVAMGQSAAGVFTPSTQGFMEAVVQVTQTNPADSTTPAAICGANDGSGNFAILWLPATNGLPTVQLTLGKTGSTTVTLTGPTFNLNVPHLVSGGWDGFNARIYLDGQPVGVTPMTFQPGVNDTFDAMGIDAGSFGKRNHFFGYSQFVAYWKTFPSTVALASRGALVAAGAVPCGASLASVLPDLSAILAAVQKTFPST